MNNSVIMGWICPRCDRVLHPKHEICPFCAPQVPIKIEGNNLAAIEKQVICRVLEEVGNNKAAAARLLGIGERTLYRKLLEYKKQGMANGR